MEDLIELQVVVGLGSFLQDLQTLWRRFRERMTVERLWVRCRRLKIYSRDGLSEVNLVRLTDLVGIWPVVMEEQRMKGQEDFPEVRN